MGPTSTHNITLLRLNRKVLEGHLPKWLGCVFTLKEPFGACNTLVILEGGLRPPSFLIPRGFCFVYSPDGSIVNRWKSRNSHTNITYKLNYRNNTITDIHYTTFVCITVEIYNHLFTRQASTPRSSSAPLRQACIQQSSRDAREQQ